MEALILILVEIVRSVLAPVFKLLLIGLFLPFAVSLIAFLLPAGAFLIQALALLVKHRMGAPQSRMERASTSDSAPTRSPTSIAPPRPPTPVAPLAPAAPTLPTTAPRWRRWLRWLLIGGSGLTATMLLALVAINQWFIDDLARWLLERQRAHSDITITAETIEGNLFTGRFQATGITVRRMNHQGLIDLSARQMEMDVSLWQVLADPLEVLSLSVDGVQGRFERGIPGQAPTPKNLTLPGQPKEKRPFIITSLTITDVDVAYADHTRKRPFALPVTVERLTAVPLRSRWAVSDVLFRANATGTIAGRPFTIKTTGNDLGRDTQWHADGLPVEILAEQIGGPFALLSSGTCDVQVVDHWRMAPDGLVIVMDWSVVLNQVHAEVPENTSPFMGLLAKPAVAFINAKGERVPLSFRVEIDENRFDGAASVEAAGLWKVVSDSAAAMLAKALGIETDTVKGVGGKLLDKAKDALDKLRKKND